MKEGRAMWGREVEFPEGEWARTVERGIGENKIYMEIP